MMTRTAQDLLAERRANVLESMRETDDMAKAMLLAHVETIDVELSARRAPAGRLPTDCPDCGRMVRHAVTGHGRKWAHCGACGWDSE